MDDEKSGLNVWKWIALSPFILIGLLVGLVVLAIIFNELNLAYWDHRVDQMCEVDGGDFVYKKVFFDKEEYTKNLTSSGELIAPPENSSLNIGQSVLSKHEKTNFRRGFTELSRVEITIFRESDKEVLAKSISYHRGGGAITILFSYDSGYSCGGSLKIGPMLSRTVFLKEKINDN